MDANTLCKLMFVCPIDDLYSLAPLDVIILDFNLVMCEMDNLLIPDSFGKFAKGFVSVLYQYTHKAEG